MQPQLPQAWDEADEWRGVTSAKERRKRQNRLHQRAHRETSRSDMPGVDEVCSLNLGKKKHFNSFKRSNEDSNMRAKDGSAVPAGGMSDHVVASGQDPRLDWLSYALNCQPLFLYIIQRLGLSKSIEEFFQTAYAHWRLGAPVARDLPILTRLNAFQALIRNATIMKIPVESLESDEDLSPFNTYGPPEEGETLELPIHLRPTALQRATGHHAWLDLFPFPSLRNKILRGIQNGSYDEDKLCEELCCDLLNMDANSAASVVIWGASWDASGWEFSPESFRKWPMLLGGSNEILEASNFWREKRGAVKIEFSLGKCQ